MHPFRTTKPEHWLAHLDNSRRTFLKLVQKARAYPEKKAQAFERLSTSMAEDGWLMLGAGETVIGQTNKLVADGKARGLYRLDHRDKADRRTLQERRAKARA